LCDQVGDHYVNAINGVRYTLVRFMLDGAANSIGQAGEIEVGRVAGGDRHGHLEALRRCGKGNAADPATRSVLGYLARPPPTQADHARNGDSGVSEETSQFQTVRGIHLPGTI
jgi:hypothetical protein